VLFRSPLHWRAWRLSTGFAAGIEVRRRGFGLVINIMARRQISSAGAGWPLW
jgi:hypothetical protein